jgi:hypothetical protein
MGVAKIKGTFIIDGEATMALGKRPILTPYPPILIVFSCLSII